MSPLLSVPEYTRKKTSFPTNGSLQSLKASEQNVALSSVGASIGADAEHLVDLAVMGAATARILLGLTRPTVGLLNIGVEEVKGLEEVREAGRMLRERQLADLDYVGFVEGDDIGVDPGLGEVMQQHLVFQPEAGGEHDRTFDLAAEDDEAPGHVEA